MFVSPTSARYDSGLANPWLNCSGLPAGAAAALAALHFAEPRTEALARLNDRERVAALDFCHHAGLALLVREVLPAATARDAANNLLRLRALEATYRQLSSLPVEFVALKGITQCELFGIRPEERAQSDIDLYCPRETVETARDALMAAGYRPIAGLEAFPTDHLPALMRPTAWKWRGDFFDPEMPLAIELHFQFWDPRLERLPAEGVDEFWTRRVRRMVGGAELAVLSPADAVAYAALHLVRHLLHGDTKPFHVYEIASFLHGHADDEAFWGRVAQAALGHAAAAGDGCIFDGGSVVRVPTGARGSRGSGAVAGGHAALVWGVRRRRRHCSGIAPNKDELWLHLSLLDSGMDKLRVARRRLIPSNLPPPSRATSTAGRRRVYAAWFLARLRYHTVSLGTTVSSGIRWWWRTKGSSQGEA